MNCDIVFVKGGDSMAFRRPVKPKKDRKIFRNTASKSKLVNIAPKVMRGGIRL